MEQKISSSYRRGDLSASDSGSDPEREFSGDDDDDRNHKHRWRESRPQSSEFDAPHSVSSKPFNKRNKSFQNGDSFRENGSRMNGGWKNNSSAHSETKLLKHDRRHFDMPVFSRPQMDINQRDGLGQTYFRNSGFPHGRGRDSWNAHFPEFGSFEFSHAANHGSVSSNLYEGRGISNVAGVHTAAWNAYGLLHGIHSGGLDAVRSVGINPCHVPPINPPSTSGIIRQKCRDFEEQGFCLRGDMCPMEHGVNRIIIDNVQSLSKFNLPVSIPGENGLGGGSGAIQDGTACTNFSVNNTKTRRKIGKSKTARKGTNSDTVEVFSNSADAAAAGNDFYDPDQPLLNKNGPESSTFLSQPCYSEIQPQEPILCGDPSCENPDEVHIDSGIYPLSGNACSGGDTHNLMQSSLGRLDGVDSRSEPKGKVSIIPNKSSHNDYREKDESLNKNQMTSMQGIYALSENRDTNILDASQRRMKGSSLNGQKPQQKAMRTIFVNGIPQKDNNIQALRSHFQKFGEIIDIYIPANGERAFVQFSTREEAEAALKAPDAVMGNRFIKLWWANRDSIPDTGSSGGNNLYVNPLVSNAYSGPNPLSISNKGRSNIFPASKVSATLAPSSTPKVNAVSSTQINVLDQGKHGARTGPVAMAPSQKKLENLEGLKEELRKKQELLEQKRNEFKQQLDKLEKQKHGAGVKCESPSDHPAKRQKAAVTAEVAKRRAPQFEDNITSITLTEAEEVTANAKPANKPLVQDPKTAYEPTTSLNVISFPLAETENVQINSSKLDKQLRSFKIVPPLPGDLANIVILREHFSLYGKVYDVELVNAESDECGTVIIRFDTHLSAEKAFRCGKTVNGNDLQFAWVSEDIEEHDKLSSASEEPMDTNGLQKETVSQPHVDSKATATDIIDKVLVSKEKIIPHEELVEDQPSVHGEEKACYSQQAKDDNLTTHEEQLSVKGYAEKTDDEDSLVTLDYQDSDEDSEMVYEKPLFSDKFPKSCKPRIDVDHSKEKHSIEEVDEKPRSVV